MSLIDVLLGQPLDQLLAALPLAADVSQALVGQPVAIRPIYDLVLAYERADWTAVAACTQALGLTPGAVQADYFAALAWADECTGPSAAA